MPQGCNEHIERREHDCDDRNRDRVDAERLREQHKRQQRFRKLIETRHLGARTHREGGLRTVRLNVPVRGVDRLPQAVEIGLAIEPRNARRPRLSLDGRIRHHRKRPRGDRRDD